MYCVAIKCLNQFCFIPNNMSTLKNLNDSILLLIECPMCFEHLKPPIYSCLRGHAICPDCFDIQQICLRCGSLYTKVSRNYILESIIELISFPCENEAAGCKETMNQKDLPEHSIICSYRYYPCELEASCNWTGRRFDIVNHSLEHHPNKVVLDNNFREIWNPRDPTDSVKLIGAHEEIFYLKRKLSNVGFGDLIYWVVQYIGKSEDTNQYAYRLQIYSNQYQYRGMYFEELCLDDLADFDDIISGVNNRFCVAIPLEQLTSFKNVEGLVHYKVTIDKI